MKKYTEKLQTEISDLLLRIVVLEEKFSLFVMNSQSEHERIKRDANALIQQQRDVIEHLTEELEHERRDRRIRRARAIARFKSE